MSACLAIDFGSAKIILLSERIKFQGINIRNARFPGPKEAQKPGI
jgi:hypothetical protein